MDLRKRRSQEKLQSALAYHLQNKTIDEITIGELTRTAGVSRQTFYSNFDSKQSILLKRIKDVFTRSSENFETISQRDDLEREEVVELGIRQLLEEFDKERVLMQAAFTGQAGIQCLSMAKSMLRKLIVDRVLFPSENRISGSELETICEFYAGALIGTTQGWLLNENSDKDMGAVARQVGRLIPHGLGAFERNNSSSRQ